MERSIRIGKDFNVRWSIHRVEDGERRPYVLAGKELVLQYRTPYGLKEATEWKTEGNTIVWTFRGKEQKALGSYELILTENGGKDGMVTVDTRRAFKLVAHSCEETEGSGSDIVIEDVVLESEIAFAALRGPQGPAGPSYNDTEIKDKIAELSAENGLVNGKTDTPKVGDIAVENGELYEYSANAKSYDIKYKAVIGEATNNKEFVFQPNYRYENLDKLGGQSNALGIVEYIPVRLEQAVFSEADADGNRWADQFQISFYFNESGRVGNVNQLIAFFDADKNHIIGSWYFGNAMGADDKKYLCTESTISSEQALAEADDATRIYKNTMNLAKTTDGSSKWGIDANGNLIGTLANVRYIGYGMTYSIARAHSIMLNNEYRLVGDWKKKNTTINQLVASETNMGKVRMWLSQDAEGNVLNISTEL